MDLVWPVLAIKLLDQLTKSLGVEVDGPLVIDLANPMNVHMIYVTGSSDLANSLWGFIF